MIGTPPRALDGLARPLLRPRTDGAAVVGVAVDGAMVDEAMVDEAAVDEAAVGGAADQEQALGERIARRFFELCENPRTRTLVMGRVRASADSAVGGRLLAALLTRTVLTPLLRHRRLDAAAGRVELVAAQLGGIAVLRYVTRMEPVASMPLDDLVAVVGPAVQATLDGGRDRPVRPERR